MKHTNSYVQKYRRMHWMPPSPEVSIPVTASVFAWHSASPADLILNTVASIHSNQLFHTGVATHGRLCNSRNIKKGSFYVNHMRELVSVHEWMVLKSKQTCLWWRLHGNTFCIWWRCSCWMYRSSLLETIKIVSPCEWHTRILCQARDGHEVEFNEKMGKWNMSVM